MSTASAVAEMLLARQLCRPQRAPHLVGPRGTPFGQVHRSIFGGPNSGLLLPRPEVRGSGQLSIPCRATASADVAPPDYVVEEKVETPPGIPDPIVKIDNQSDRYHTVVSIQFGDRLGELLDTIEALKRLGLSIRKAKINPKEKEVHTLLVTDAHTADKINRSSRLEEMRFVILANLLKFHPEAGKKMGGKWGERARKPLPKVPTDHPLGARRMTNAATSVVVRDSEEGGFSEMDVVTTDRPGLLTDIVKVLKDINVNVISAEIDTEGPVAKDQFLVSYHGDPLNTSMATLVQNALQYYLGRAEVEAEESY